MLKFDKKLHYIASPLGSGEHNPKRYPSSLSLCCYISPEVKFHMIGDLYQEKKNHPDGLLLTFHWNKVVSNLVESSLIQHAYLVKHHFLTHRIDQYYLHFHFGYGGCEGISCLKVTLHILRLL